MGATVSIVNKTKCVLYIAMTIIEPYYWEDRVMPGEAMVRKGVGHVWFTITANAWNGNLTEDPLPMVFTNVMGENFTMIHDFGLKGEHDKLLLRPWPKATLEAGVSSEEWKLIENQIDMWSPTYNKPFLMESKGWYINGWNGEVQKFEIRGGPHCEYRKEFYRRDGQTYERTIQLFDKSEGLNDFYAVKINTTDLHLYNNGYYKYEVN